MPEKKYSFDGMGIRDRVMLHAIVQIKGSDLEIGVL